MSKIDHFSLFQTQIPQTEWLVRIGHVDAEKFRAEDNEKRTRLQILKDVIGLPYDQPQQFTAREVADRAPNFAKFLAQHGDELCGIHLIPVQPGLPKRRIRGRSITDSLVWFAEQAIDVERYRVDFVPHASAQSFSTIFIVNPHGVFGEIIAGSPAQLTQGIYEHEPPTTFAWDFKDWTLRPQNPEFQQYLTTLVSRLRVPNAADRQVLVDRLQARFAGEYLCGYFETTDSDEAGLWFVDYNRILGTLYEDHRGQAITQATGRTALLQGSAGSMGVARGRVRIVDSPQPGLTLDPDEILVCHLTSPDYAPLMQQAAAIVTDMGGVLSHAAIVARELKKPCLVATQTATSVLKDGQLVEVNADEGTVYSVA